MAMLVFMNFVNIFSFLQKKTLLILLLFFHFISPIFPSHDHQTDQTDSLLIKGDHAEQNNPNSAILYFNQAITLALQQKNYYKAANLQMHAGKFMMQKDRLEQAKNYFNAALENTEFVNDTINNKIEQLYYLNMGVLYFNKEMYTLAIKNFLKSKNLLLSPLQDISTVLYQQSCGNLYNNLGSVYGQIGFYDKAKTFFLKSLTYVTDSTAATTYQNLGYFHIQSNQISSAIRYIHKGLKLSNDPGKTGGLYTYLAQAMALNNLPDSAEYYHKQAIYNTKQSGSSSREIFSQLAYASFLRTHNRDAEAHNLLLIIKKNYQIHGWMDQMLFKELHITSLHLHNNQDALQYFTVLEHLRDSVKTSMNLQKALYYQFNNELEIKTLKMKMQYENRQNEIQFRHRQNMIIIYICIFFSIGIIILLIIRLRLKIKNSELKKNELKITLEQKKRELTAQAMFSIKKNKLVSEAIQDLRQLNFNENRDIIRTIERRLKNSLNDDDIQQFEHYFCQVHEDFYDKLKHDYPHLTPSELRLCALLKLNLNTKEIAAILNISPASVKTARGRLRIKLNLNNSTTSLFDFLGHY